jgi:tetratricopeptide (TPR) repeat protein
MKNFLFACMILCSNLLSAQPKPIAGEFETQYKVYRQSLQYLDLQSAATAVLHMIALKPERKEFRDSLMYVYFTAEKFSQAFLVGESILKDKPDSKDVLEVVALSKQQIGMVKEALPDYEKLYQLSKDLFYLYQIAGIQYQLKRMGECQASVDQIISDKDAATRKVTITNSDRSSEEVSFLAAALNIKSLCLLDMGQTEQAKNTLNEVIKLEPGFRLAAANLRAIESRTQTAAPASK